MENRIRQLREERHMTQVRLSVELGVSQETVSSYEKQKHYPSFAQLLKMAALFHASIDYIMGLSDVRNPVSPSDAPHRARACSLLRQLDEKQLELVCAYMQGMLDIAQIL